MNRFVLIWICILFVWRVDAQPTTENVLFCIDTILVKYQEKNIYVDLSFRDSSRTYYLDGSNISAWDIAPSGDSNRLDIDFVYARGHKNFLPINDSSDYLIVLQLPRKVTEQERILSIKAINQSTQENWVTEKSYKLRSSLDSLGRYRVTTDDWLNILLSGALFISLLLAIFSILIPDYRLRRFKRKFIRPYRKIKNPEIKKRDPLTDDYFQDDELVVVKCEHTTSLATWEYLGNHCIYYPDRCKEGVINVGSDQFFFQQGLYRRLNWLWFGALGGWLAWGIWALIHSLGISIFEEGFGALAQSMNLQISDSDIQGITREFLSGLVLGLGLSFTLTWVEERGQIRKISWGRIILRTILGGLMAGLIFSLIAFLLNTTTVVLPAYVRYLLSWLTFSLFLGIILSIRSSISLKQGMLSCLIAGLLAFHIFYLVFDQVDAGSWGKISEWIRLLSFVLLGTVLGTLVNTVVSHLEDFELEYLSPAKFRRVNAISKWLKAEMDIYIGTDPSCYVFVKWQDEHVQSRHAKLSYHRNAVYLEPYAETLVNGQVIPSGEKRLLKHEDIIQLGKESISRMMYKEKRKKQAPRQVSTDSQSVNRPAPQIKISKRN